MDKSENKILNEETIWTLSYLSSAVPGKLWWLRGRGHTLAQVPEDGIFKLCGWKVAPLPGPAAHTAPPLFLSATPPCAALTVRKKAQVRQTPALLRGFRNFFLLFLAGGTVGDEMFSKIYVPLFLAGGILLRLFKKLLKKRKFYIFCKFQISRKLFC